MGLEIDIPGDLSGLRLPLVEVKNLSMREALLKVLEGSNYDYILVAVPDQPDRVRKLVVPVSRRKFRRLPRRFDRRTGLSRIRLVAALKPPSKTTPTHSPSRLRAVQS